MDGQLGAISGQHLLDHGVPVDDKAERLADARVVSLIPFKADRTAVRRLIGLGVPIAATYGSEAGFFSLTALLAGSFGPAALAAHTAVNQLVYIVFQVAVGLSHAASINVSREIALGNHARAQRLMRTALGCAALVMAVVGAAYVSVPRLVLAPFLDASSDDAVTVATHLLIVAAVLQFFDCTRNIGVGLLRGLDDTKTGFRATLIGYWAVDLPASCVFAFGFGWDTVGLWLRLLVGLAATAALLMRAFDAGVSRLAAASAAV
ncbi:hypothetical protein GCM10023205_61820 [Yinghuangia aomiensis]|uniref:Probable multidrug resistance protein NorM n=1 Tax=Yinghuangia aomiensis TaxID=676205 RepID=A0ABP9HZU0_9ACTN